MDPDISILDIMGHGNRKLRVRQVRRIRELYFIEIWDEDGIAWTQERLAERYKVGQGSISGILNWTQYGDVDPKKAVKLQARRTNKLRGSRWRKVRRGE